MREERTRQGIRLGAELGMVLAGLLLLYGIVSVFGAAAVNTGADMLLQLFGAASVQPAVSADAGGVAAAAAVQADDRANGEAGGIMTARNETGHTVDSAWGVSAGLPPETAPLPHFPAEPAPGAEHREPLVPAPPAPRIALTFDDGPDGKYTPMVLDILAEYGVTATFFVVGTQVERYPDVLKRILDEGHEIGGHGHTHADMGKMKAGAIAEELRLADEALLAAAGVVPELFRPPYGSVSDTLRDVLEESGRTLVRWNIDPRDWDGTPAADIAEHVLEEARDGGIVLLHSFGGRRGDLGGTIEALPVIIEGLLAEGYELTTVSDLEDEGK